MIGKRRPLICAGLRLVCVSLLAAPALRAELVLTNYSAANPLKIMSVGDSITDDCSTNGAWRLFLQPLLQTNGYAFTNVGRFLSNPTGAFTKVRHEGICGAVIAYPGMFGAHNYPTASNYALNTVADALTNTTPDLFLIDLGVNDMGYGRNPWFVATNQMAVLLDLMFAKAPSAQIIVGKPTSITRASIGTPTYSTYGTNMPIFCTALQSLVTARRAMGQNVFVADLFSAVDATMMGTDYTHPNPAGYAAIAKEFYFRIAALTVRTDQVITPFINANSVWKYSDQGLDLGTNWVQPQYDDSSWSVGPGRLGYSAAGISTTVSYGTNTLNKYITTYFRSAFSVPTNAHYTNLLFRLNRADGAIVWLNGHELFRTNMAPGPVTFQTRATNYAVSDAAASYYPANIRIGSLPVGSNCIAVEIHKYSPSLASLSFDMELFGIGEFPPRLAASLDGPDIDLRWPATNHAGFILVSGTNYAQTSTWSPLGGPYILNGDTYQYREPVIREQPAYYYALKYVGLPATGPSLAWVPGSNALGLSWPVEFAGFNLEFSTGMAAAATWQVVPGPYVLTNDRFSTSISITTSSQQFYRLRREVR